jgi:hypothetical protein
MSVQQVFAETVRILSPADRLRLAAMILDELTRAGELPSTVDSSDIWSEQDQKDVTAFSLSYAAALYPENEDLF